MGMKNGAGNTNTGIQKLEGTDKVSSEVERSPRIENIKRESNSNFELFTRKKEN